MKKRIKVQEKELISLQDAIINYDFNQLEIEPSGINELMEYYLHSTDPVYSSMRKVFTISFEVIDNEIRAMLGHCVDIDISNPQDKNLDKAYSHFRRMNIDSFKIICDEIDKFYTRWFKTHYKCDFSNMRTDFLQCITEKYCTAKSLYIQAQHEERVGSDFNKHKILKEYSEAALAYVLMYKLYVQYRKKVQRVKIYSIVRRCVMGVVAVVSLVAGVVSFV